MVIIYLLSILFVLIVLLIYLVLCILLKNKDNEITTILTTCCRNSAPDTSMILENIEKIHKYTPLLAKKIIIVFDGADIKYDNIHKKCKGDCHKNNYIKYKKKLKRLFKYLYPYSNIRYIEMPFRCCLTNSLKTGIEACTTPFINIVQEDLILKKKLDVSAIIQTIKQNKNIDVIRYDNNSNQYHFNYTLKFCNNKYFKKEIIQYNGLTLSKSNQYCDQCHITTKEYYKKYIFPNINDFDFMEHSLLCQVGDILPETIWHLDDYEGGFYIEHRDGRNA